MQIYDYYNYHYEYNSQYQYHEEECPWYYFDSSYKTLLGACLFVFGVFGVLLNGWLFATFIHSHLLIFKSHILILNLCIASLGKNIFGFPFAGSSAIAKRWLFGSACCQFFAFTNQFFGVYQMTALFVSVLERCLLARHYKRERSLQIRVYWSLVAGSLLPAIVFAVPPLFGSGAYSCDVTGTACALQWTSLQGGAKMIGFSVPFAIICGVLPVVGMFFYMGKTVRLERIYYKGENPKEQKSLTQSVHVICVSTLALWIPAGVLIGWQWFPQLVTGYRAHIPPVLALIAPIASEAATTIPVLCYLIVDERLRAALLGRMRGHYALLHPERAKKFNNLCYKEYNPLNNIY